MINFFKDYPNLSNDLMNSHEFSWCMIHHHQYFMAMPRDHSAESWRSPLWRPPRNSVPCGILAENRVHQKCGIEEIEPSEMWISPEINGDLMDFYCLINKKNVI